MLELISVEYKNFMSYGNNITKIDFTEFNSLIITGPNGSGKSSLSEVLYFILYGKPYRKTTIDELTNKINKKGCYGKIEFSNKEPFWTVLAYKD